MTKPLLAITCCFCWLALALVSTFDGLRADEGDTRQGAPHILARLPISFRLVDRDANERSLAKKDQSAAGLPLAPRGQSSTHASSGAPPTAGRAIATVVSSLAVVAGLLVVVTWFARKYHPAPQALPKEVFVYLGTTNIAGRQAVHVMRFGDKLLLAAAGPTGLQPLAELTNTDDVQRLTALCRPTSSSPISSTLQRVVADWSRESSAPRGPARPTRSNSGAVIASRVGDASHA